jgi:hypothetical protein
VDFRQAAAGTGLEPDEWTAVANGPGTATYSRRGRKWHRYTALALLFLLPLNFVAIGAVALASGLEIRSQVEPVPGWRQTTGWIAGSVASSTGDEWIYAPVVWFRADGRIVRFDGQTSATRPSIGAPARVSYDPRYPAAAHDLSQGSVWEPRIYVAVTCLVLGVGLMAFFYWLVFVFVRQKTARGVGVGTAPSEGRHVRSR